MIKFLLIFLSPWLVFGDTSFHKEWRSAYNQAVKASSVLKKIEKPCISIFGGGATLESDAYYIQAYQLAQSLANKGFVIITGGNFGIMKGANSGASSVKNRGVTNIVIDYTNSSQHNDEIKKTVVADHLFNRKWLLMRYSSAFVVFPGGVGTLDELTEMISLFSTGQYPKVPIFVVGTSYWKELHAWLNNGIKAGLIAPSAIELLNFIDDIHEVEQALY